MKICFIKKIKEARKNKLVYIVIGCFTIAIILIAINFYLVNNAADEARKNIVDYFLLENINEVEKYSLDYELIVFGNKKVNRYKVTEEYKKIENEDFNFIFNTTDENNISLIYEVSNSRISIYSNNQLSKYEVGDYQTSKINLYSLYTFFNIYYKIKNNECECNEYIYNEDYEDFILFGINFDNSLNDELNIYEYNKILDEKGLKIKKLEIQVDKNSMLPTRYVGYDINGNSCFEIIFNSTNFV